jgi:hypothetical protein
VRKKVFLFLLISVILALPARGANLYKGNLYGAFKDKEEIRVYLKEVENAAGDVRVNVAAFRDIFRRVLPRRVNIKFREVNNARLADAVISAKIKRYKFKENAMLIPISIWAVIADTTAPKSSAKLTVDYRVLGPDGGKALMELKNFTTTARLPKGEMTGDKSFRHAAEKSINRFLYRAFHKQKKKSGF